MKKQIKYIAFYSESVNGDQNRLTVLSSTNKIDYISKALNKNNYEVQIISPSWTNNTKGFYKAYNKKIEDGVNVKNFATFGAKSKIAKIIKYYFSLLQLFIYLLIHTKKNEPIIVYHSIILYLPIKIAKFLKGFKLILEVEEIYQDVQSLSKYSQTAEYRIFKLADKYIFPTELLNSKLNTTNKPYTIIYGTYQVKEKQKRQFDDGKIHVVYAGTFDSRKGGALAAATVAEYLPENYHIHIIGFGTDKDKKKLLDKIEQIKKISKATLSYDGMLKGEKYIDFLQKCHIGLSTQIPNAAFSETSFPSKILSYMANGLRVISVRIKAIEMSAIGNEVYYYDRQKPKAIAEAIMGIDVNKAYDSIKIISSLDKEFTCNIKELLEN